MYNNHNYVTISLSVFIIIFIIITKGHRRTSTEQSVKNLKTAEVVVPTYVLIIFYTQK